MSTIHSVFEETVLIETGTGSIYGSLAVPERAWGAVLFADGCGSDRYNPRDSRVAESLQDLGLATLVIDLLTPSEEDTDDCISKRRIDFRLLTERLNAATDWIGQNCVCTEPDFRIGYIGTCLGGVAALRAAGERNDIAAVISCGGRPDWAGEALPRVAAATLLVVGGLDRPTIEANYAAYEQLGRAYRREVVIIPQATNLVEEPAALEELAHLATQWFVRYLGAAANRHQVRGNRGRILY